LTQRSLRPLVLTLLFTTLGFLVMGYHPGMEDDAVYLAAVKADLQPALFPHNAGFIRLQLRLTVFDTWMAHFVTITHIPLPWAELFWQLVSLFLILWAARQIAAHLFAEPSAQWAGVAMLSAMFTLPVAGTALIVVDQHLHPRNIATALILLAVSSILERKGWRAIPLLVLACALHPIMGVMGISFSFFLAFTLSRPIQTQAGASPHHPESLAAPAIAIPAIAILPAVALANPFSWIFQPPSPTWLEALNSRHWFRLYDWEWYEWLGAIGPLVIFWIIARIARKRGEIVLSRFATAVFIYGIFQQAVAMILLGPKALIVLSALEPMRYLHLVYIFLTLIGGCYAGRYLLKSSIWRWAVFLLILNAPMYYVQRQLFANTVHLELPNTPPSSAWLQAFDYIKHSTPTGAYFALDPKYLAADGEDYHGFRALAERSSLADSIKDTSVVTKVPQLGPDWKQQTLAQAGWSHFQLADFERLKSQFGVDWVLIAYPQSVPLDCHWHNATLAVCQIP